MKNSSLISDCANSLKLSSTELRRIVQNAPFRYKVYPIEKRNGEDRWIAQPAKELKAVQNFLISSLFYRFKISDIATAYRRGLSIVDNASPHKNSNVILKLDFRDFFHSIYVLDLLKFLRANSLLDDNEIKFVLLSCFWSRKEDKKLVLSIGAPSSPIISNILMFPIDESINSVCSERKLVVTRYADDITISGSDFSQFHGLKSDIVGVLRNASYPTLFLNDEKTVFVSKRHRRRVTGLVLSNSGSVTLGRDAKRAIRANLYRASKFGIDPEGKEKLNGKLAFAQMVDRAYVEKLRQKYPLKS